MHHLTVDNENCTVSLDALHHLSATGCTAPSHSMHCTVATQEALILHHLTVANDATADYIVKYIDFFEIDGSYFLVTEYAGDSTLNEFVEMAFKYIDEGKLNVKEYRRIVKYLFWQISVECMH